MTDRKQADAAMIYTVYLINDVGELSAPAGIVADNDEGALREAEVLLAPGEEGEVWHNGYRIGRVRGSPLAS
jgi:hypothetical protein